MLEERSPPPLGRGNHCVTALSFSASAIRREIFVVRESDFPKAPSERHIRGIHFQRCRSYGAWGFFISASTNMPRYGAGFAHGMSLATGIKFGNGMGALDCPGARICGCSNWEFDRQFKSHPDHTYGVQRFTWPLLAAGTARRYFRRGR